MAQRKYIILILYPFLAYSNPWIPEVGTWKYSFEISQDIRPKSHQREFEKFKEIEKQIILLEHTLNKINLRIALLKDNQRNDENKNRLEIFRHNRIDQISKLKKNLKQLEGYLYLDYKLGSFSNEIEYGYSNKISFGVGFNSSKSKYSDIKSARLFGKYKLYEKKRKILNLKAHFDTAEGRGKPGISIIWGGAKKTKKLDNFSYNSFGIEPGPIYLYESMIGSRLKDYVFMVQAFGRLEKNPTLLYSHLLRKQYKIAKEFDRKFALSIAYHEDVSLSARRILSNGFSIGIWGEI